MSWCVCSGRGGAVRLRRRENSQVWCIWVITNMGTHYHHVAGWPPTPLLGPNGRREPFNF